MALTPDMRADSILGLAAELGGGVSMATIYAAHPNVSPSALRRTVARLVARRALAAVRTPGMGVVYLTTVGTSSWQSGVRHYLSDPKLIAEALATGRAGSVVKMPQTFVHDQVAALVAVGIGGGVGETEHEIRKAEVGAATVGDGYAWPEKDRRIVVEIERMVRQSPGRWQRDGGLVDKIARSFVPDNSHPGWIDEYLVVAPRSVNRLHEDLPAELAELVSASATRNFRNRTNAGWWFLPIGRLDGDPEWYPVVPNTPPWRLLPGIHSRRAAYAPIHAKFAEIDRARKASKEAERSFRVSSAPHGMSQVRV